MGIVDSNNPEDGFLKLFRIWNFEVSVNLKVLRAFSPPVLYEFHISEMSLPKSMSAESSGFWHFGPLLGNGVLNIMFIQNFQLLHSCRSRCRRIRTDGRFSSLRSFWPSSSSRPRQSRCRKNDLLATLFVLSSTFSTTNNSTYYATSFWHSDEFFASRARRKRKICAIGRWLGCIRGVYLSGWS